MEVPGMGGGVIEVWGGLHNTKVGVGVCMSLSGTGVGGRES